MRIAYVALAGIVSLGLGTSAHAAAPGVHVSVPYMMTVRVLDEDRGSYQVEVDNTNPFRFINSYTWTPPPGLTITKITSTVGGECRLSTEDGTVTCKGEAAGPSDYGQVGQAMIVNFTASGLRPKWIATSYGGYYISAGVIGSVQVTEGTFSDLPLCKKGQTSTKQKPCTKT
jgi:hypothetical protein